MYGYEPPEEEQQGSWREVLVILGVVFGTIGPILAVLVGSVLLIALTIFFLIRFPPLALIPLTVIGAGIYLVVRRDRRLHEEGRRRVFPDR